MVIGIIQSLQKPEIFDYVVLLQSLSVVGSHLFLVDVFFEDITQHVRVDLFIVF